MTSIDRDRANSHNTASAMRSLPAVHRVVDALADVDLPRPMVIDCIRRRLDDLRSQLAADPSYACPAEMQIIADLRSQLGQLRRQRIGPLINATGIIVHTNFGRSPLGESARLALQTAATQYTNLEYDLSTGERGKRAAYVESALALLCGAEAATVVNNCAAALVLLLHHFAGKPTQNQVIVSRGELIQIGGGFRVPEIMQASGAVLREVGTTNKTSIDDFSSATGDASAMILRVHRSNFYMAGFVESPAVAELAGVAQRAGLPLVVDLGSGATFDTAGWSGEHEPTPAETLSAGADLVCFSGDKLLGGPQAGIIAGRADHIAALKKQPLFRALRCDKLVLAALEATADELLAGHGDALPIRVMASTDCNSLEQRAGKIIAELRSAGIDAQNGQGEAKIGGGSLPQTAIPSVTVDLAADDPQALSARLRLGDVPVIGYLAPGRLRLDLRTVLPHQDPGLIAAVRSAWAKQ